jgi:hypothetical protein
MELPVTLPRKFPWVILLLPFVFGALAIFYNVAMATYLDTPQPPGRLAKMTVDGIILFVFSYWALKAGFNRKTISRRGNLLVVREGPFPWPGQSFDLDSRKIEKFESQKRRGGRGFFFLVQAVLTNGKRKTVANNESQSDVRALAETLAREFDKESSVQS